MILLLDTSKPDCEITLYKCGHFDTFFWPANRELSDDLLKNITNELTKKGTNLNEIDGLGVYEGPGSFTGLRIGITVMNTIADSLSIPIYGARGENWKNEIIGKFEKEKKSELILPFYGADAKITLPKK